MLVKLFEYSSLMPHFMINQIKYFIYLFFNYFEKIKICQTNANFYQALQSLTCLSAYWHLKEFPDIDRKLSIKVYSFPSNLSWPHRLHLLRSSWGFDQTTEIRFGSPKFDCSLVSNEHLGDGCMDLLAERMEWFQNQDH